MSKTNQVAVLKSLTFKVYKFLAWNPLDSNPKLSAKIYFWAAMAYTATCLVQEIIYFVLNFGAEDSFLNLTNLAPCMGFTTLACIKILTVYGNRMQVTNIYKKLESFCSAPNNQIETVKMVKPSLKLTNALTRCYLTLIWMFNLAPLFVIVYYFLADGSYHRQMPYVMWYPWDCNQPFYYEFSYAVVTWGAFTSAIGILSTDLMLCNIVTLCCIRFNKLRIEIKRIVNGNLETSQLRKWIDDHTELLDIVDDIEGVFALSILLNFLGSSLILCLVGFQTLHGVNASDLFKFCLFLISSLVQIFVICWHGEQLTGMSQSISEAVYCSKWTEKGRRFQNDLQFILLHAQKPKFLTASKFSKVSLNNFIVIIGTSFSYFTFMRSLYDVNQKI